MMFKTHVVAGAMTGILIAQNLPANELIADEIVKSGLVFGGAVLGSMFPDIDTPSSKLGRKVKPLSWLLLKVLGHRGFTHSFPFLILFSSFLWFYLDSKINPELFYYINYGFIGFAGGFLSHLLLDWVTKKPIPLFYPISSKGYALGLMKTNGVGEFIFRWLLIFGSIYFLFLK